MPPKASIVNAAQPSLDGWLSVTDSSDRSSTPDGLCSGSSSSSSSSLPSLQTHSPPLLDKDSIFLASTFPLSTPPNAHTIRTLVNLHLSPPWAEGLPKVVGRGEGVMPAHRMWAWRCLSLKKGRRVGLEGGEDDWEIKEGSEDDGEQYGGDRLLQVMRDQGAVDCIVFCCRWFGGTLLGPIRFAHIQSTARHALNSHLKLAELQPLLVELQARDARIAQLRSVLPPPLAPALAPSKKGEASTTMTTAVSPSIKLPPPKEPDYTKVTDGKTAERLLVARGRTLDALERKVAELKAVRAGERAEASRRALKRAAEAVLVEDDDDADDVGAEGEGEVGRAGRGRLPEFRKRKRGEEPSEVVSFVNDESDARTSGTTLPPLTSPASTTTQTTDQPSAATSATAAREVPPSPLPLPPVGRR